MKRDLTGKEQAFLDAFFGKARGSGTQAAILAGYAKKSAHVTASRLLRKANVRNELDRRNALKTGKVIADAAERDEALTGILRGPYAPLTRIRAIQEMNKVEGRHITRIDARVEFSLAEAMQASRDLEKGGRS